MSRQKFVWIAVISLTVVLALAAAYTSYFPGDVPLAQGIQAIAPKDTAWAKWVTNTAKPPLYFLLLGIAAIAGWLLNGRRAVLLAIAGFAGALGIERLLKALIARPRPSASVINVVETVKGSSFPSTFALVYASTFGFLAILAVTSNKRTPIMRQLVFICCCIILLVGAIARIVMGAHWVSDLVLSYLIGGIWATLLIQLFSGRSKETHDEPIEQLHQPAQRD